MRLGGSAETIFSPRLENDQKSPGFGICLSGFNERRPELRDFAGTPGFY